MPHGTGVLRSYLRSIVILRSFSRRIALQSILRRRNSAIDTSRNSGSICSWSRHLIRPWPASPDDFVKRISTTVSGRGRLSLETTSPSASSSRATSAFLNAAQKRFDFTARLRSGRRGRQSTASSTRVRELLRRQHRGGGRGAWPPLLDGGKSGRRSETRTAAWLPNRQPGAAVPSGSPAGRYLCRPRTHDDGRRINGACSIGERPNCANAGRSIETYLFDFDRRHLWTRHGNQVRPTPA